MGILAITMVEWEERKRIRLMERSGRTMQLEGHVRETTYRQGWAAMGLPGFRRTHS